MKNTKTTVLKYWKSWQIGKQSDMEETVAEDFELYMLGKKTSLTKQGLLHESFENWVPWEDVTMISEIYSDDSAALFYRGINTTTNEPVFMTEHIYLNSEGLIEKTHVMMIPPPNL